jgi:glycosyltransferase involved in cell wall biosynthesis
MRFTNLVLPHAYQLQPVSAIEQVVSSYGPTFVVISQGGNMDGFEAMTVCKKRGVPYCNVIQEVPEGVDWPDDGDIERQRPLYQNSRRLFFASERNLEFMETQFVAHFANAAILRNRPGCARERRVPWPVSETPLRLACLARIDLSARGQDLLADVFCQEKWRTRPVLLDFYGSGPNRLLFGERIRTLELSNVALRGPVWDEASIWADHHALVLPSRQEGLPQALVQAFLCGRPAVVTRVGGNAELVEDGLNGFVADAPTAGLLDLALERLWDNRSRLADIGSNARRTVDQKVDVKGALAFAEELLALARGTGEALMSRP